MALVISNGGFLLRILITHIQYNTSSLSYQQKLIDEVSDEM
jgi:hypothetical protein